MNKKQHLEKTVQAIKDQIQGGYGSFIRSFYSHYLLKQVGLPNPFSFPAAKFRFQNIILNTRRNTIDFWACLESYEPDLTYFLMQVMKEEKGTFIDVGGHIGRFTVLMAKNGWKVLTFEPLKTNFDTIKLNLHYNQCLENADVRNVGLGINTEQIPIYYDEKELGESSVISDKSRRTKQLIDIVKFDEYIKDAQFDSPCIVKIDIEGNEENAINGMKHFLAAQEPLLVLELWEEHSQNLKASLKSLGYKRLHIFWFKEEKHQKYMDKMYQYYNKNMVHYEYE